MDGEDEDEDEDDDDGDGDDQADEGLSSPRPVHGVRVHVLPSPHMPTDPRRPRPNPSLPEAAPTSTMQAASSGTTSPPGDGSGACDSHAGGSTSAGNGAATNRPLPSLPPSIPAAGSLLTSLSDAAPAPPATSPTSVVPLLTLP